MGLPDPSLQSIGFRLAALFIIVGVHGGAVAAAAVLLGDKGPRYDGRLTPVPTRHIDLVGSICMLVFGLGWSKQVEVECDQLRGGRYGVGGVILAGFISLLVAAALLNALVLPALTGLSHTAGLTMAAFLRAASDMSIWVALLSLVPMPPLTGGLLVRSLGIPVSREMKWVLVALLLVAMATGMLNAALRPAHDLLVWIILGR